MPDIIGEPLAGYVKNQINHRQELHGQGVYGDFGFSGRGPEVISALNSSTAWIKLASGVEVTKGVLKKIDLDDKYPSGMALAKQNILYSGLSEYTGDKPLKTKDGFLPFEPQSSYSYGQYGFSPMPGITSAEIKALNRGSIKKATIKIKAHNREQFNILDVLYMRLGYTVLLEWGNSTYITKDRSGQLVKDVVRNTVLEEKFFESSNTSYRKYLDYIEDKRYAYKGNYDGLLAKISNFDWTFNDDGSYDITLTLISMGDVIESLKTNISIDTNTSNIINVTNISTTSAEDIPDSDNINRNAKADAISSILYLLKLINPPKTSVGHVYLNLATNPAKKAWCGELLRNSPSTAGGGLVPTKWTFYTLRNDNITYNTSINTSLGTIDYASLPKATQILNSVDSQIIKYAQQLGSEAFAEKEITLGRNLRESDFTEKGLTRRAIKVEVTKDGKNLIGEVWALGSGTTKGTNPLDNFSITDGFRLFTDDPETNWDGTASPDGFELTYYLRLGYLLQFIRDNCIPKIAVDNEPLINISTNSSPMLYIKDFSMSLDPRVCVVNTPITKYDTTTSKYRTILAEAFNGLTPWSRDAMNVYLNFNFILDSLSSSTDERGDVNLYDLLSNICNGINRALGGVNNLEPIINEETNTLRILDSSYTKTQKETDYRLNLYGYKKEDNFYSSNFVRKIDLRTAITPEYATMVTIGTTAGGYVKGTEGTAFAKWNTGITDRFKQEINSGNNQSLGATIRETRENYNVEVLAKIQECFGLSQAGGTNAVTVSNTDYITTQFKDNVISKNVSLGTEFFKIEANSSQKSTMGFVPFKLGITMDGISGIKIYNKINIDTSFLPSNYGDTLDFIITGVNHSLQNNDWTTEITTMAIPGTQDDFTPLATKDIGTTNTSETVELPSGASGVTTTSTVNATLEPGFLEAIRELEDKIGTERNALYRIIKHESGFNPAIQNPYTNATGLIQFIPSTANGLGTSIDILKNMTGLEQLVYVEKFYKPFFGRARTIGDLYLATFLPAAVGKPDNFVIGIRGATTKVFGLNQNSLYVQNTVFDWDSKGYYTVGDIRKRIEEYPL